MTKTLTPKAALIIGLLFTLIWVSGCDRSGKNEKHEQQPPSQAKTDKPIGREELRIGNSTYYVQKDKPVNTQILEIAIDSDDQAVIDAFLQRARSGDANAKEAMRTANPERYISLTKRGKYDIDAQALAFLKVMDGFGNRHAHEALKAVGGGEMSRKAPSTASESTRSPSENTVQFTFSGVSPLAARPKADAAAQRWKRTATLHAVFAEKWELYGDPMSRKVTGMQVPEWRFVYAASGTIGTFIVTESETKLAKEENAPSSPPPNSPLAAPQLENWDVDAGQALGAAFQAGVNTSEGPWLWMRKIQGRWGPVWTVLAASDVHFVSAKTGEMLSKQSVE